ncbi:unnamed protein product, partial [Choristocarpus tenellus]
MRLQHRIVLAVAIAFIAEEDPVRAFATSATRLCDQHSVWSSRYNNWSYLRRTQLHGKEILSGDSSGAADVRLAGWRVASKEDEDTSRGPSEPVLQEESNRLPACGDVVEYPLTDLVKQESGDGRERGVAVVVSINKDRNDAWQLPEDILNRAELQVLCPDLDANNEGKDGTTWMADELEPCAFAMLNEMKTVRCLWLDMERK